MVGLAEPNRNPLLGQNMSEERMGRPIKLWNRYYVAPQLSDIYD